MSITIDIKISWWVQLWGNTRSHSEYGSEVHSADYTWLATAWESRYCQVLIWGVCCMTSALFLYPQSFFVRNVGLVLVIVD